MIELQSSFYVTGGNLSKDAACYVQRRADTDLYQALRQGEFCYVLNSRQMGKSSLMVRVATRLCEEGVAVAVLDLNAPGRNLTAEQWYDGLLCRLGEELHLEDELEDFWQEHQRLGPLQRWMQALRHVVLTHCEQPVVIFVDEIDVVRSLPFSTDEFFAAIRECYNRRSTDPAFNRLTFCLLGVATPSDLIRDTRTTPFNIGRRIELEDFTPAEAAPLAAGLGRDEAHAGKLLKRILYWTGGHPYLTQRLCQAVAQDASVHSAAGVDRLCEEMFLSTRARERDNNLLFVRERLLAKDYDRATLLDLYRQVRERKRIHDDNANSLISVLRLAGIVRVLEGYLWVRNRIYFRVFDREWIIANMPDAELRRQQAAYRRGVIRASAVAAVIIISLVTGIYWYLDGYVWEHASYYSNPVKRWGQSVGINQFKLKQIEGRSVSFKHIYKGRYGPLLKMQAVNSRDECTPNHPLGTYLKLDPGQITPFRECQWEFIRDSNDSSNRIVYEKAYNKYGQMVWGFVYSPLQDQSTRRAYFVGPNGFLQSPQKSYAEFVELQYSPKGDEISMSYFDHKGNPQPGPEGAFSIRSDFYENGLVRRVTYLDDKGQPMNTAHGNAGWKKVYDEFGNTVEMVMLDTTGQPVMGIDGFCKLTAQYDERGNRIEEVYFDTAGQPTLHKLYGFHRGTVKYDEHGNPIEFVGFNTLGRPTLGKAGFHKGVKKYDEHSNQIELAFFDVSGELIRSSDGFKKQTWRYYPNGKKAEETIIGLDGSMGFTTKVVRYDESGKEVYQGYFNDEGRPAHTKGSLFDLAGFSEVNTEYAPDGRSAIVRLSGFEPDQGFGQVVVTIGKEGKPAEIAFFDSAGQPTLHKDGYHKFTAKYDERGNRIEEAYFDTASQPTLHKLYGFHKGTAKYDEHGNQIEVAGFDTLGHPTLGKAGFHKRVKKYDEHGNQIELAFFDVSGELVRSSDGFKKQTWRYYPNGKKTEEIYIGLDGSMGFTTKIVRYDESGREVYQGFFDDQGKPAHTNQNYGTPFGYGELHIEYMPDGRSVGRCIGFEPYWSYAQMVLTKDREGKLVESVYFDTDGKPVETEVMVTLVQPNSPAEKMGIKVGDILTYYDGKVVKDLSRFINQRSAEPPDGSAKELRIRRNGKTLVFQILPGKMGVGLQGIGIHRTALFSVRKTSAASAP